MTRHCAIFVEAADVTGYVLVLDAYAALAERSGDRERAARLSGAVEALEASSGTGLNPANRKLMDFEPEHLRTDPATARRVGGGCADADAGADRLRARPGNPRLGSAA